MGAGKENGVQQPRRKGLQMAVAGGGKMLPQPVAVDSKQMIVHRSIDKYGCCSAADRGTAAAADTALQIIPFAAVQQLCTEGREVATKEVITQENLARKEAELESLRLAVEEAREESEMLDIAINENLELEEKLNGMQNQLAEEKRGREAAEERVRELEACMVKEKSDIEEERREIWEERGMIGRLSMELEREKASLAEEKASVVEERGSIADFVNDLEREKESLMEERESLTVLEVSIEVEKVYMEEERGAIEEERVLLEEEKEEFVRERGTFAEGTGELLCGWGKIAGKVSGLVEGRLANLCTSRCLLGRRVVRLEDVVEMTEVIKAEVKVVADWSEREEWVGAAGQPLQRGSKGLAQLLKPPRPVVHQVLRRFQLKKA